jgi:hypothetical protein
MNTADTIFLNWHILMTIWKIKYNLSSEREKVTFHFVDKDKDEDITFFRLFGVDSRRIYKFVKGGRNFNKKDIDHLIDKTNISRKIFDGTRLLVPVNENDDLHSTFVKFVIKRKQGEHPSKHRELYNEIKKYLKGCEDDFSNSRPINPELQKAFAFITNGHSSVENQQLILDMSRALNDIKYRKLLDIDSQYLFTYLKALRKQEKLVTTAITHNKNIK